MLRLIAILALLGPPLLAGCESADELPRDARTARYEQAIREKWGKPLDELPVVTLDIISPHNENITTEFEWAFSLHHALAHGQRVDLVWWDVGGGGSSIEKYLLNVYDQRAAQGAEKTSGIDILWGGGPWSFAKLARPREGYPHGLLEGLDLAPDVLENVPQTLGGQTFYERVQRDGRPVTPWIGSALSGFGFLYNKAMLRRCGLSEPVRWADLAGEPFTDLLTLADPGQSGSAAAAYRMIAVSGESWPDGWAKLLAVLSNARRFTDSAGAAANAPVLGDGLIATCIDFYGILRVAGAPEQLVYISPPGETTFGPDPIGILRNPPHPELAQRFVNFVMSREGQALWALTPGERDGPVRTVLGRQPIRRDVYALYADRMAPRIVNPFEAERRMRVDPALDRTPFGVLRQLVVSAAVDNVEGLRAARKKLNALAADPADAAKLARYTAEFNRLPANVATIEAMRRVGDRLKEGPKVFRAITVGWRNFFAAKYARIAEERL
jgi:ABC-type Fe3+ transport system substrate-binding protein